MENNTNQNQNNQPMQPQQKPKAINKKVIAMISAVVVTVGVGAGVMFSNSSNSNYEVELTTHNGAVTSELLASLNGSTKSNNYSIDDLKAEEMRLQKVNGEVELQNNGTIKHVVEGSRLITKDNITTKISSDAYVVLDSTKAVRVDELSNIEINKNDQRYIIDLNSGSLFFNVTQNLYEEESLEFRTNNIVTGVRGTSGIVTYDEFNKITQIAVLTGTVVGLSETENDEDGEDGEEKIIEAGEMAIITTHDDGSVTFEIISIENEETVFDFNNNFIDNIQNDLNNEGNSFNLSEELREPAPYVIEWIEPAIEEWVRKQIDMSTGDIYNTDLLDITRISVGKLGINSLEDVKHFKNVTSLYFSENNISDLTPLAGLINLTDINFYQNNISDITPLAGLVNLIELNLWDNNISDITPLSGLINVERVEMHYNQISDLTPLTNLPKLDVLLLAGNNVSDLTPLAGITSLNAINLDNNNITDLTPLAGLYNLRSLYADSNNITDVTPLSGLTNLTMLYLNDNNISDTTPIDNLPNLVNLYIRQQTD